MIFFYFGAKIPNECLNVDYHLLLCQELDQWKIWRQLGQVCQTNQGQTQICRGQTNYNQQFKIGHFSRM